MNNNEEKAREQTRKSVHRESLHKANEILNKEKPTALQIERAKALIDLAREVRISDSWQKGGYQGSGGYYSKNRY